MHISLRLSTVIMLSNDKYLLMCTDIFLFIGTVITTALGNNTYLHISSIATIHNSKLRHNHTKISTKPRFITSQTSQSKRYGLVGNPGIWCSVLNMLKNSSTTCVSFFPLCLLSCKPVLKQMKLSHAVLVIITLLPKLVHV
jgi:hypothetical protein